MADAQALENPYQAPGVLGSCPHFDEREIFLLQPAGKAPQPPCTASQTDYFSIRSEQLSEGAFFNDQQVNEHARVAMIGTDLATTLFWPTNNLVGQSIRINGQTFTIIGVLKSKGGSAVGSSDNQVIIPITTARDRVIQRAGDEVDTIYIQATSAATASQASTQVFQYHGVCATM